MGDPRGFARVLESPIVNKIREKTSATRNALLGSLTFQRWASALPLTRPVAQRRAREVFDLCAGFVYSQILYACVKLQLFQLLSGGARNLSQISSALNLAPEPTRRLLDAAAALKLVERFGADRYGLGPHGAVIAGNPGILKMIEHHAMLYADLSDPVALLRGERKDAALSSYWAYATSTSATDLADARISEYTALMAASQTLIAEEILATYPIAQHRCLMDVGGGDGTFVRAVAAKIPSIELKVFDLPAVAECARQKFASAGISQRATAHGGNFFCDPLPEGADLISLVRIIHDHDDEPVRKLFSQVRRALRPGGKLIVAEPMSGSRRAETVGDAYFGFYLMAMGSGRPRSASEIISMLQREGFTSAREIRTRMPLQTSLIVTEVS
ncbi:MAG: methyltransferase [Hyphomicrobium sp.]|nr:MAG: methyltransferase [Hyphomicrobium sp.]